MKAEILTPMTGDGLAAETAFRPLLLDIYPAITSYVDTTGQPAANLPTSLNLYIIEIEADPSVIAAIEADPNYEVLWSE